MTAPTGSGGVDVLSRYMKAMVAGHINTCIAIEEKYDLYGYPPEIVSVGLRAVDEGRDPNAAVDVYLAGDDTEGGA